MTIFAIRNDGYDFQELDLKIDDVIDSRPNDVDEDSVLDFSLLNYPMARWWPTPDTEFVTIDNDQTAPIPDISKWIDASLVLSAKAFRLLGDTLKEWGEILPITVGSENFYIFNCLTFGAVQKDLCEKSFYKGEEVGLKSIVFDHTDVAEKVIFKTDLNSCMELYCGDRLKNVIEEYKLTGVIFSERLVEDFN
jgi:hypothetical protein